MTALVCSHPGEHRPRPHEIDEHHVVPRSWNGPDVPANRVPLCAGCHHNTHWLIDAYVRAGGEPPASVLRLYTQTERDLAARAWAGRPAVPTFTMTAMKEHAHAMTAKTKVLNPGTITDMTGAVSTGSATTVGPVVFSSLESRSAPAPGPGARVARTASQAGGTVVLLELCQSFGWLGSAHWSAAQAAVRWPALTAAVGLGVSALHNLANWRQGRKA